MKKTILCLMTMMGIMTVSARSQKTYHTTSLEVKQSNFSYICTHIVAVYFCIKVT